VTLSVEYKNTYALKLYPNNARTHSEHQVEQIVASINEFGFTNPILIDEQDEIIAGHGRLMAALKLPMKEVPTITLKGLSKEQKQAYVIADNKLALNAGWDLDLLSAEIQGLIDTDFQVDLLGFDTDELHDLLFKDEGLTDPDDVPDVPRETTTKTGDLWLLGKHRLLCGDATNAADVKHLLNGDKPHLMVTDPPYGVGFEYEQYEDIEGRKYIQFCNKWWALAKQYSERQIVTVGATNEFQWFQRQMPNHVGIWTKTNSMTHGVVTHFWAWEPILFYGKFKRKRANDVFEYPISNQKNVGSHTCPKPLALMDDLLTNFSKLNDYIVDFFLGSGSTLIAAERTSRICFGLEIDPAYCDVIVTRWQNYTGKKAQLQRKEQAA